MESLTPRTILTWAIVAAVILFVLRWVGPILVLVAGIFVALLILDGLTGGTAWVQILDRVAVVIEHFIEAVANWINSGGLATFGI